MGPSLHERAAAGPVRGAVLILYGGRAESREPSRPWHLSAVRMRPFARALHRWGADRGVAVLTLRYRVRGWNGADASPVADALWALAEIRSRHGDIPVCLVGHSMGGRAAFRTAGERGVVGVLGLAPWLPPGEPVAPVRGRRVLVVHGTADRWTDPAHSRAYTEAARSAGAVEARWVPIPGLGHFMLRRRRTWRRLTVDFVESCLTCGTRSAA